MLVHEENYLSIEQSELFRRISTSNAITHITLDDRCTLNKMKLFIALCPRVQHLSIYPEMGMQDSIIRFLFNPNTCHLCLLCIRGFGQFQFEQLIHLLKSQSLFVDYTLKFTGSELYLWW